MSWIPFSQILCFVTPRTEARLLQAGNEKLLQLAKECDHWLIIMYSSSAHCSLHQVRSTYKPVTAEAKALASFDHSVKNKQEELRYLDTYGKVSMAKTSAKRLYVSLLQLFSINVTHITETLISIKKFSRDKLQDVERELAVLWVAA